jgi:uroporphyrinogen-III decarboxylase
MPIGTDLVLHEHEDVPQLLLDGVRLGQVMTEAARRWETPLALALMDLTLEKELILQRLGVPEAQREQFHLDEGFDRRRLEAVAAAGGPVTPRMQANLAALRHVKNTTSLAPVGMAIGPFSLATKLLADPITPVYLSGSGARADEEPEIGLLEAVLELATDVVLESVAQQAAAGAEAIVIAEPAANIAYFSPNQLAAGADVFERYVTAVNLRIARRIRECQMDLLFHCCGELTEDMVRAFGTLEPAVLSLGSSRRLWHDASIVSDAVVLYGNLPTKRFYSDELMPPSEVQRMTSELIGRMRDAGHPFILGSECDVLSVNGAEQTIRRKVELMMHCRC